MPDYYLTLDEKDQMLYAIKHKAWLRRKNSIPRVGDFLKYKNGEMRRVAHVWGNESVQPSLGASSIYMDNDGTTEYSGGLDPGIKMALINLTDEILEGTFWFFRHDEMKAHNGIYVTFPCQVWEVDN